MWRRNRMCSPTFKTWFFPCYLISCYKTNNDSWKLKLSPQLSIDLWDELKQSVFQKTYRAIFSRGWKLVWSNFQNYRTLMIAISCIIVLTILWRPVWKCMKIVVCIWMLRQFAIQPCYFYCPYQWQTRMKKPSKSGFYHTRSPLLLDVNTHIHTMYVYCISSCMDLSLGNPCPRSFFTPKSLKTVTIKLSILQVRHGKRHGTRPRWVQSSLDA